MTLSDLEKQRSAAHVALNTATADVARLNTESMVAMKTWLDAQQIAEDAYGALTRKQSEHARALLAMTNARLTIVAILEHVQAEIIRKTAQA